MGECKGHVKSAVHDIVTVHFDMCRERFLDLVNKHKERPALMKQHITETVHMDGQNTLVELFEFEL